MDLDAARGVFELNVWGVIAMVKAFSPLLINAKGTIVNISSMLAAIGLPFMGAYNASKAALDLISQALRIELSPLGVETVTITTGTVKTNFFGNQVAMNMPKTSRYYSIKDELEKAASKTPDDAYDVNDYSKHVVKQVLKSNKPARYWYGGSATVIWLASTFLPWKWTDSIIVKATGFGILSNLK
jgi:1-acylglycerone phosphate reductase